MDLKRAIGIGIGLFIAIIGLVNAGVVADTGPTLLALDAELTTWPICIFVVGLALTRRAGGAQVKGALLIGILVVDGARDHRQRGEGPGDLAATASRRSRTRSSTRRTSAWSATFSFDFFSVLGDRDRARGGALGDAVGLLRHDGHRRSGSAARRMLDANGRLPGIKRVLLVDSLAAAAGGAASSSSNTTYIESASGISEGGRTGLVAVVVGVLFLLAMFFSPIAGVIPPEATAPALVIVGYFMMVLVKDIDWSDPGIGIPALLTIVLMPFTYSITNGVGAGFVSYTVIAVLRGKVAGRPPAPVRRGRDLRLVLRARGGLGRGAAGRVTRSAGARRGRAGAAAARPPPASGPPRRCRARTTRRPSPSAARRLLLAEQRRGDPARREPLGVRARSRFWIAAPPDSRNISRSACDALGVGVGMRPAKRTHGTMSTGAAPRTASLLAIRRSIVASGVPSPRRSSRHAVGHRAEQPPLGRRGPERGERPGPRVVRRRRGARGARPPPRPPRAAPRRGRTPGSSGAPRSTGAGTPEQILLRRADQVSDAPADAGSNADAPDDRRRDPRGLAHHEPARGRDLVGERHDRSPRARGRGVGGAAEVDERGDARAADRHVDQPSPPGPAERVGDHDGRPRRRAARERRAEPLRGARPDPRAAA